MDDEQQPEPELGREIAPGTTRYLCPVRCGWYHDVAPLNPADVNWDAAQGAADVDEAISRVAQDATMRTAATTEAALVAHLDTHTTVDFVTALEGLHGQVQQLTEELADHPAAVEDCPMTETLDVTVRTIVRTSQFTRSEVEAAIETLRAYPDNEAPTFTPWTDEQLSARLPTLVELAASSGQSLLSAARGVRRAEAAGVTWAADPA